MHGQQNVKICSEVQYENVYPKGQADPDNQHSDKWSYTVSNFMKIPTVGDELFHAECFTVRRT